MPSYITAMGTAVPPHKHDQTSIQEFMKQALELNEREYRKLKVLYRSTGIQTRYSVLKDYQLKKGEFSFYPNVESDPVPSVSDRMDVFRREAPRLTRKAIDGCFTNTGETNLSEITHLITVSCTGMYAPGLDIDLVEQLGLSYQVKRTAVNFMGCYGAFNGLKVADAICRADRQAKVLVVSVELCTLHFRYSKREDDLLSAALFADGAACLMVEGVPPQEKSLEIGNFYCDLFPQGSEDMAWNIGNDSFIMRLSSYIPDLVGDGVGKLVENLLGHQHITIEDIAYWAVHPGGKRILQRVEELFQLSKEQNRFSHRVMEQYGNMSSATYLFVLADIFKQLDDRDAGKNILGMAFGPGLTLESMLLRIV